MFYFEDFVQTDVLYEMMETAEDILPRFSDKVSGVYFLYNFNDEIIYVGKASNILTRYQQHKSGGGNTECFMFEIDYCKYIRIDSPSMRSAIEGLYIHLLKPRHNSEIKEQGKKPVRKLSKKELFEVYELFFIQEQTQSSIASIYGISQSSISDIVQGKSYNELFKKYKEACVELV